MHERHPRRQDDGTLYGKAHTVTSDPDAPRLHAERMARLRALKPGQELEDLESVTVLAGTEFDELVVGSAIHIEQLDASLWYVDIGGLSMDVTIDRDGKPRKVFVREPEPVEGCRVEFEGEQDRHVG